MQRSRTSCHEDFRIFAGSANPALAAAIARTLNVDLGGAVIDRFPDGEVAVQLTETVRRKHVLIVQSTAPPVNDHLVELLVFADACRRAAAERITAVVPYFGYARADKRHGRREPITARVVADVLQTVGIAHVVTMDLHTPQIEGFFHAPVDTLTAVPILCDALRDRLPSDVVVVSPDRGRVSLATSYAQCLGAEVVVMHKRRDDATHTQVTHMVGEVSGRACLIVDDMISTGGTMAHSVNTLLARGARPEMYVAATHGLLVSDACARLDTPAVRAIFVTDTIEMSDQNCAKLQVVSIAGLVASALQRFLEDGSTMAG
jgi:ribose-phosphate pyrophosphokinase